MPKYSRMRKYQDLRNRLDQDTTEAQTSPNKPGMERLSRVKNNESLSHASKPARASRERTLDIQTPELPKSPVMNELIDEVKQYNLNQGTSVSDDTQINILKQLDGSQAMHRNQHFVQMEEQEEDLGSTMKLPVEEIKENVEQDKIRDVVIPEPPVFEQPIYDEQKDDGPSILPVSETPSPVHPIEDSNNEAEEPIEAPAVAPLSSDTNEEPAASDATVATKERIVLSSEDFISSHDDTLDSIDEQEIYDRPTSKEKPQPKKKKKRKNRKQKKFNEQILSEKDTQKEAEPKETKPVNNTGTILNVVLIILVILLIIAIAATVVMIKSISR